MVMIKTNTLCISKTKRETEKQNRRWKHKHLKYVSSVFIETKIHITHMCWVYVWFNEYVFFRLKNVDQSFNYTFHCLYCLWIVYTLKLLKKFGFQYKQCDTKPKPISLWILCFVTNFFRSYFVSCNIFVCLFMDSAARIFWTRSSYLIW